MILNGPDSYYVAGGTLADNDPSYVFREADAQLNASLEAGQFCYILDTRQVGKSSLIVRAASHLQQCGHLASFIDLSTLGDAPTSQQWYSRLLLDLVRGLGLEDEIEACIEGNRHISADQLWFTALRDIVIPRLRQPMTVFVDEIDAVRKLPFKTDNFFASIRALHNLRAIDRDATKLTFCLAGVASPSHLIQDLHTTPFNIGKRIELRDFTAAEMAQLAPGLHGTEEQRLAQIARIHYWTSGHPFLTQRLCKAVAARGTECSRAEIDQICEQSFITRQSQTEEYNLQFVTRQLVDVPERDSILQLFLGIVCGRKTVATAADPLISQLLLSGVACIDAGADPPILRVRNAIYASVFTRRWVIEHLSGAEKTRQRRALWIGYMRASAVWTVLAASMLIAYTRQQEVVRQRGALDVMQVQIQQGNHQLDVYHHEIESAHTDKKKLKHDEEKLQANIDRQKIETAELTQTLKQQLSASASLSRQQAISKYQLEDRNALLSEEARSALLDSRAQQIATGADHVHPAIDVVKQALEVVDSAKKWNHPAPSLALTALSTIINGTPAKVQSLKHNWPLRDAEYSPDDKIVVTAGDSPFVTLWDRIAGKVIVQFRAIPEGTPGPAILQAVFTPKSDEIITLGSDQVIRVWSLRLLLEKKVAEQWSYQCGQPGLVTPRLRCSRSGDLVAVSASDNNRPYIFVINTLTQKCNLRIPTGSEVRSLDISSYQFAYHDPHQLPSERFIAFCIKSDANVHVWDMAINREIDRYRPPGNYPEQVLFGEYSAGIWTSSDDGTTSSEFLMQTTKGGDYRVNTGSINTYLDMNGKQGLIAASGSGQFFARASTKEHMILVWPIASPAIALFRIPGNSNWRSLSFGRNDRLLLTATATGEAEGWLLAEDRIYSCGNPLTAIDISPSGQEVLASTIDKVSMWYEDWSSESRARNGFASWEAQALGQSGNHPYNGLVMHTAFSPNGKMLATAGQSGDLRIWYAPDPRNILTEGIRLVGHSTNRPVNCSVFSPDSTRIISASEDGTARLWDTKTGNCIFTYTVPSQHSGSTAGITSCCFTHNGELVVLGCKDGAVRIYPINNKECVLTLQAPGRRSGDYAVPWSLDCSPDGRFLLSADGDGNCYLWDLRAGKLTASLSAYHDIVFCARFSPDGKRILSVNKQGFADIWRVESPEYYTQHSFLNHPTYSIRVSFNPLYAGQFSPDGHFIYVGGKDGIVRKIAVSEEALLQRARWLLSRDAQISSYRPPSGLKASSTLPFPRY